MRKIVIILGTRPQIIKSAPVLKAFKASGNFECSIINTGQHYDYEMNRKFFKELDLPEPEVDLGIGQGTANEQIAKIVSSLDRHLMIQKPDLAIVPGDTNSALAAGIACSKLHIKIAHLEAGCRSNDFRMSEEVNRRILDHISQILLSPTSLCYENLRGERVLAPMIENVGDTMLDSFLELMSLVDQNNATKSLNLRPKSYAFMTAHRAENVDHKDGLSSILEGIGSFEMPVIFPAHPRTKARLQEFKLNLPKNVTLVEPLPYFDTLRLVKDSKFVVTDSGGLQKEAYWLEKPALILRDTTEWMEIIRAGAAILTGSDASRIQAGYSKMDNMTIRTSSELKLFGNGHAALAVVDVVERFFSKYMNN